jgi:fucose permease
MKFLNNYVSSCSKIKSIKFIPDKIYIFLLFTIIVLIIANIFYIIFSLAIQTRPDKVNEILCLIKTGVSGGTVIPFIMGLTSDSFDWQVGYILIIFLIATYLQFCVFVVK